jgi:hypothetical protein
MKNQNASLLFTRLRRVNFCLLPFVAASGSATQYDIRITQYGSIKIEQLCETNPIFQKVKYL